MDALKSALAVVSRRALSIVMSTMALFGLFTWIFLPPPSRADLVEIVGALKSYSVEQDSTWIARNLDRRRTSHVLFALENYPGRFWSDVVDSTNASDVFRQKGAIISVFHNAHDNYHRLNGDGQKTYGLTVNGKVIETVDEAVAHDQVLVYGAFSMLGLIFLWIAVNQWKKESRT